MKLQKNILIILFISLFLVFAGCSGGGGSSDKSDDSTPQASGVTQKGPFLKDSNVSIYELVDGVRTGNSRQTQTIDNTGKFTLYVPWSNPTEIEINGDYIDESSGLVRSGGKLSAIVKTDGSEVLFRTNVNILTHIAAARIKKLLQEGKTFDEANREANGMLKSMFNLDISEDEGARYLDVSRNDKSDNAQLLKLSAALLSSENPQGILDAIVKDASDGDMNSTGVGALETLKIATADVDLNKAGNIIDNQTHYGTAPKSEELLAGKLPLSVNLKFDEKVDVDLSTQIRSNVVTLVGYDGNVTLSVKNGMAFITHSDGTIKNLIESGSEEVEARSSVQLINFGSSSYATKNTTVLDVSGRKFSFATITKSNPNSTNDSTPNSFDLGVKSNVEPSQYVKSNTITVGGLSEGVFVDVTTTDGKYSVNGDANKTATSKVTNGDRITLYDLSSNNYLSTHETTLTIGGVSGKLVSYTRPRDVTPTAFSVNSFYNVEKNSEHITSYITTGGYEGGVDLDVINGEAQLEGDTAWVHHMTAVPVGTKIRFVQNASSEFNTKKETKIYLGNFETSFVTVTKNNPARIDTTPNPVEFTTLYNVEPNSEVISNEVTITGIAGGSGARILVHNTNEAVQVNGGDWIGGSVGNVQAGDKVRVKFKKITQYDTHYKLPLYYLDANSNSYKVFGTFEVYTAQKDTTPDDVAFDEVKDAVIPENGSKTYYSNVVTISGLSDGVEVDASVVGASGYSYYSKNGAAHERPGKVKLKNGDTLQLEISLSDSTPQGYVEAMFLNFKDKSYAYTITTNVAPQFLNKAAFDNIQVGDNISFRPKVRDTQSVTFSLEDAPAWLDVNATSGEISGQVASGIYKDVKLIATDSGGLSSALHFDIVADVAPELVSDSFGNEYILDDNAKEKNAYYVDFNISDVDTDISDLNVTMTHEINESRVPADGINKGFNDSKITCDLQGHCGAKIAIDFTRSDGLHPSLKTRHYITVSDGIKSSTKYVDIWYAPTTPVLSGQTQQSIPFTSKMETAYQHYSFTPTNSADKAERWAIVNKPVWADFSTSTGELSGTPALDQNGSYNNIQIQAYNDRSYSFFKFNITVVDKTPPKKFELKDFYGVEINKHYDTFITVDWLADGATAEISSSGYDGQASHSGFTVNGDNSITTVKNGDVVRVGHLSSNSYDTQLHTTLTIGSDSDDFITKTKASADVKLPLIVGSPKTRAKVYERYSYTPQLSTDYSKYAPVTKPFEIENKPEWALFDTQTGELSGTPSAVGSSKNIKIIAYGDNGLDDITFDITINKEAPDISGSGLSLDNPDMNLTFNDNADWRSKVTQISMKSCYAQQNPTVLNSADYTLSKGQLLLHDSTSLNVALHTPSMSGVILYVDADGYPQGENYLDAIQDGVYGVKATLSSTAALVEDTLDGAKVQIELENTLQFADSTLDKTNFVLTNAPDALSVGSVRYIDATHAEVTLAYNGIDFDSDALLSFHIDPAELNAVCADNIQTNTIPITAVIEKPYINMLYPDDPSEDAKFGYSVVDFNDTIVSAAYTGAYLFTKDSDGNYTQKQKIIPPEGSAQFGTDLAMDGDYFVVTDTHHFNSDTNTSEGVVYVYKKDTNGHYAQIQELTATGDIGYQGLGNAVSMSGTMLLVGAEGADDQGLDGAGRAYLYKRGTDGKYALVKTISRSNAKAADFFGHDVAIRHGLSGTNEADTYYMLVGSNALPIVGDNKEELGAGFANYYVYKDDALSSGVVVYADDTSNLADHFGSGVALDGGIVVVGSANKLYTYARGQGDALLQRVKIENAGVSISGKSLEISFTGFDKKARYVIVSGEKSFISTADASGYSAYQSHLVDGDALGYSASVYGFEVVRGAYSNDDMVSNGGAALVTNAYENITSTTSSALTPPVITAPAYGYGLAADYVDFTYEADDTWKNAITNVLYKAGVNAQYVTLGSNDYTLVDNKIRLQTAQSTNVALHTPYESKGSLLVKADGYLDDVVTISRVSDGYHAIKATLSSDTPLKEDNLDGAIVHIAFGNTLEFANTALDVSNFTLIGAPNGVSVSALTYGDAEHADLTLAFDGTDFDDNITLRVKVNAVELNAYESVTSENTLDVEAITEVAGSGVKLQAVDPYITNARFWYDKNNNAQIDDFELSTYSDENGTFSFTTAIDDGGVISMVESGLHNGRPYDANLTLEYNITAPAFISPVTTLQQKGFTLDEVRTLLVDAGVDSDLNVSELIMDPMDPAILPADGNMSTYSVADLAKFRRIFLGNAALNAVIAAQDAYGLDKANLQDMLTHVFSMGEGGEGSPAPTSLLSYIISVGNLALSDGNLKSYNARAEARIYVALADYVQGVIRNYIVDNGALDDGILYELQYSVTDKIFNIKEAMTNSYTDALAAGVIDPKIEWVRKLDENSFRPLWMVEVANLAHVSNKNIMIIYKDANGDAQKVEFDIDGRYLENYQNLGQWSISGNKVLANSKEYLFRGTKLTIDGVDYSIIDAGIILPDAVLGNFYEEIPPFTSSSPVDGAVYVDVNSSFRFDLHTSWIDERLQKHTSCSLAQGYNGNVDVNVSFNNYSIYVTPAIALKHNLPYSLRCNISYGDDSESGYVGFISEELYLPIMKTGQVVSYFTNGDQAAKPCDIKDDGCYQSGHDVDRNDNGDTVLDLVTRLEWEDDGQTDTNSASNTSASYGPCEKLTLDSKDDWRTPTALEMMSLFDFEGNGVNGFENISTSSTGYWTTTKTIESPSYNSDEYIYVIMPKYAASYGESYSKMHMCVRVIDEPATDEVEMKKEGDVVMDYKDKLMWEDDAGVTQNGYWADAIGYCEDLSLGGYDDWRMPNINELVRTAGHSVLPSSDVNQEGYPNSTNTVFSATAFDEEFWSSTTDHDDHSKAYILQGKYGSISSLKKTEQRKTRCVRDMQ